MKSFMFSNFDGFRQLINHWWLTLLVGIFIFTAGVVVFYHPAESYHALSVFFGLMIILAGAIQIYGALTAPKGTGRGWLFFSGIIELILGVIIVANLSILINILPFFLAFWLLFRGIGVGVFASDMRQAKIKGVGWIVFFAALLIVCSLIIFIYPMIGIGAIVIWLGISFVMSGVITIALSIRLRGLKKYLNN